MKLEVLHTHRMATLRPENEQELDFLLALQAHSKVLGIVVYPVVKNEVFLMFRGAK